MTSIKVVTSHGEMAVTDTGGSGLPVLFIHGNSSSRAAFRHQFSSDLAGRHRLIAIDLPGHGESADAINPERTYSMPGYAAAVMEVLTVLGVRQAAVYGWSLGGHVALEMVPRWPGLAGVMITGAPPVGRGAEAILAGFSQHPHIALVGQEVFSEDEARGFVETSLGTAADPDLLRDALRTDGRARALMFASLFTGGTSDQKEIAENCPVPLAIVNGSEEPFANLAYVETLAYHNLWDGRCHVIKGAGHAPFWTAPDIFNPLLSRFVREMETGMPGVDTAPVKAPARGRA
ncbi:MAG: alpha/beta fold hydrolase [Alphaproteobacteria bacterium]